MRQKEIERKAGTRSSARLRRTKEIAVFAVLGTLLFLSKLVMEGLPNIHLVGVLTVTYTLVFRKKAIFPVGVFILLSGFFYGFGVWWIPYLWLWPVLWAFSLLLPKEISPKMIPLYAAVATLHGLFYGILYAPFQAAVYGMGWNGMIAWYVSGIPFDLLHAGGNLLLSSLIFPLALCLDKLKKTILIG